MMKILVTCPPMLGMIDTFRPIFEARGVEVTPAKVVQVLSEDEQKLFCFDPYNTQDMANKIKWALENRAF